ncbi:hypothetical protein CMI42_00560 [Candidatus Pacearchaeota archaeon]|nr:hypothetical protein [Candidatus Pacearchaeota archaeon]|tara:strand:- start:981 stop:2204 length:1224 start_codon:yes stop_codon:yes gene_type:complete
MFINEKRVILTIKGRKFIRELKLAKGLPKSFKKNYSTIIKWENGKNNPTLTLFSKYLKCFHLNIDYFNKKNFVKEIAISMRELGVHKTTKIIKEKHSLLINDYRKGSSLEEIGRKYGCTASNVFYILKRYNIDTSKHSSGENYSFPKSQYIKYLIDSKFQKEDFLPLIASLILTDGCLYQYKGRYEISYYGTDEILHNIFADLIWYYFGLRPSSYMIKCGRVLRTKYIDGKISSKLLELSPSYKTKPSQKENWNEFLKNPKSPSLNFMKNYSNNVVNEVIRLAMCADGSISVSNKKNKIFFTLILSCAHPSLVKEWSELFNRAGINNRIVKGSGKTKIGGVKGIKDCINYFYDNVGFIKDVKICVHKSPFYGIEKQKILAFAAELLTDHDRINTVPLSLKDFKSRLN